MTEPVKKGREPKYALWELLLRTAEQRKETPVNRAVALGRAFHVACEKAGLSTSVVLGCAMAGCTKFEGDDQPPLASAVLKNHVEKCDAEHEHLQRLAFEFSEYASRPGLIDVSLNLLDTIRQRIKDKNAARRYVAS